MLVKEVGMPAMEAIVANPSRNAWLMSLEGEVGVIAPGKLADIVIWNSDPVADITVLQRPTGNHSRSRCSDWSAWRLGSLRGTVNVNNATKREETMKALLRLLALGAAASGLLTSAYATREG